MQPTIENILTFSLSLLIILDMHMHICIYIHILYIIKIIHILQQSDYEEYTVL